MSEFKKLLSRRERGKPSRDKIQGSDGTDNLLGLFGDEKEKHRTKIADKDLEKKVKEVQDLLMNVGITKYREQEITFVLKSSYIAGDSTKAYESLVLLQDSEDGIIKPYDAKVKLKGAVNHNGVSCYLDSVLFSMLCRLDSFETMLYNTFDDAKRNELAVLLRLWVNTVRDGRLVEADLTKCIQDCLATCGWTDAAKTEQQDASEAFSFITDKLNLPMLTLKMDLFHIGKEDDKDDHKFIRERLLEVAVPDDKQDGKDITLEECLETYFNSRVEVKRYLERRGTNPTASGMRGLSLDTHKMSAVHIESVEITESGPSTPADGLPSTLPTYSAVRPGPNPHKARAPSIIQDTLVYEDEKAALKASLERTDSATAGVVPGRPRAGTLRKEVLMPAWQFFSLIPWYTDIVPNSDAQIEAHLKTKRPVLGICLKRYTYTSSGEAIRRGTHIDVPIEIALPQFIHDDSIDENAAAFGNFKLSLQSVVCHRGKSVHEGHYISLVRGLWPNGEDKWMLFDDLASERIRAVDIVKALNDECPYLLFYQIQPIEGDAHDISRGERPPSYLSDARDSAIAGLSGAPSFRETTSDLTSGGLSTGRPSLDEPESARLRGRTSFTGERRSSMALSQGSTTDLAKAEGGTLSPGLSRRESRRSKHNSHSRANSTNGERRLSKSFQNLAGRLAALNPTLSKVESANNNDSITSEPSAYSETAAKPASNLELLSDQTAKLRKDRDKSVDKSRGKSAINSRHLLKNKKSERPDRECSVM